MTDSDTSAPAAETDRLRLSFGSQAVTYDAVRPDWPEETVRWLLGSPAEGRRLLVADVGCGTGKGSRAVAMLGHEVDGIDPSSGMLAAFDRARDGLPGPVAARLRCRAGSAEALPLPDHSVDVVVSFQAWHWFDQEAAAAECARVLRPGGYLSLAWHHRDEDHDWTRELSRIVGSRQAPHEASAVERPVTSAQFEPAERGRFGHRMRQSVDDVVLHASTWSYVAMSPRREAILQEVRTWASGVADTRAMVEIPMTTWCYRQRRR